MGRPLLGHKNRAEGATLSGGSFNASWPRDNMKTTVLAKVAETTDALQTSSLVKADLGTNYPIRMVTFHNHNARSGSQIEIRYAASEVGLASATPILQDIWLGGNTPDNTSMYKSCALVVLPADADFQWWQGKIIDESNPDGVISWGYFGLWEALEMPRGTKFGAVLEPEPGTSKQETIGRVEVFDRRLSRRTTRVTLEGISQNMADEILDIVLERDLDRPMFWLPDPDPDNLARILRRSFVCRARALSALEAPNQYETSGFNLAEIVGG